MGRKVQVPVVGGIRKVIRVDGGNTAVGTTIQEFGSAVVSLAQLKVALGIVTPAAGSGGGSTSTAVLIPGQGLSGGGALLGAVPLSLRFSTPPVIWNDALLPDDFVGGAASGSAGGTASPLTTKGDVYVFGTSNTRLGVGADGQVLTARAGATNGLDWETVSNSSLVYTNTSVPAGNTVANTVTATAFASTYTVAANTLSVGAAIRVTLRGVYSTAVAAPTISVALKLGSTTVLATGSVSPLAASASNDGWSYEALLIVQTTGATGTVEAQGTCIWQTAASTAAVQPLENTAAITVDTTAAQAVTAVVTWGTASASNTITLREMAVWIEGIAAAPSGGGSAGNITADTHPAAPTAYDDEFETGTSVNLSKWAWVNQGTATGAISQGSLVLTAPASASDNHRSLEQVIPAGSWGFSAKITVISQASYFIGGMLVRVSGTDKRIIFAFSNNGGFKLEVAGYTNATTYGGFLPVSTSDSAGNFFGLVTTPKYFRITFDGASTWTLSLSVNGVEGTYLPAYSANINTAFLGAAPDRIGLVCDSRTSATATAADWFRRTA